MTKIKLTNLETKVELYGFFSITPTTGKCFHVYLTGGYNESTLITTEVIEVWEKTPQIIEFKTMDSAYRIELINEYNESFIY